MFYCNELPFRIIPLNRFLNIETMNTVSSYDEDEIALFEEIPNIFTIYLMEQNR